VPQLAVGLVEVTAKGPRSGCLERNLICFSPLIQNTNQRGKSQELNRLNAALGADSWLSGHSMFPQ
jgi:hypothetical protein